MPLDAGPRGGRRRPTRPARLRLYCVPQPFSLKTFTPVAGLDGSGQRNDPLYGTLAGRRRPADTAGKCATESFTTTTRDVMAYLDLSGANA